MLNLICSFSRIGVRRERYIASLVGKIITSQSDDRDFQVKRMYYIVN